MQIALDVNIPRGFEATGEYRRSCAGEWVLYSDGTAFRTQFDCESWSIILRPKKRKVIAFVYVESFEQATDSGHGPGWRWGLADGWQAPATFHGSTTNKIQWLRREEREE